MSNEQSEDLPPSIYPRPPPYWEFFKPESLEQLKRLRQDADIVDDPEPISDLAKAIPIPDQPHGLKYLIPPPEPEDEAVITFGAIRYRDPPLPPGDTTKAPLYPDPPSPTDILRLTRASLLGFLEFFNILAVNPQNEYPVRKFEDITYIQANIMRALNEYRQWAAREQAINLMEQWVQRARSEIAEVDRLKQQTNQLLGTFSNNTDHVDERADGQMELDGKQSHLHNGINDNAHAATGANEEDAAWDKISLARLDD